MAKEIEVTPAMVAAGVDELAAFNSEWDSLRDFAESIYLAMERVRRSEQARRLQAQRLGMRVSGGGSVA